MEKIKKIIEISLLIIALLGILGVFIFLKYERDGYFKQPQVVEEPVFNTEDTISHDQCESLDKAYYDYILKNNDTIEMRNYWGIKNSRPDRP